MRYKAVMYKNEGMAVRLLMKYGPTRDSVESAMQDATKLKTDNPAPEFWVAVVSKQTAPHSFS